MIRRFLTLGLLLALAPFGCDGATDDDVISRERFIEVYVELRTEAPIEEIPDGGEVDPELLEARDRVLQRHGVEAEDLLHFVEVHGRNLDFMHGVWAEIEARMADSG